MLLKVLKDNKLLVLSYKPLASESLLIEDGSVGAEERVLDGITDRQRSANVEHLASSLDVSVVT